MTFVVEIVVGVVLSISVLVVAVLAVIENRKLRLIAKKTAAMSSDFSASDGNRLQQQRVIPFVDERLASAGIEIKGTNWVVGTIVIALVIDMFILAMLKAALSSVLAFAVTVSSLLLSVLLSGGVVLALASRRKNLIGPQLARACPQIAAALRSGASPSRAVLQAGRNSPEPLSGELVRTANEAAWSGDLGSAMERLAVRLGGPDAALLAAAVSACQEKGGSLAKVFEDVGKVMDKREELRRYAQSQTSSARLEAWMLFAMVLVLFVVLCVMQEGFWPFYQTVPGFIVAGITVLASIVGMACIYAIAQVKVD